MAKKAETPMEFKITVDHDEDQDWHKWIFPNGWRGIGPVENRDSRGALQGNRDGIYPPWFVLSCNNPQCPARAVMPVTLLTSKADDLDPMVKTGEPR